MKQNVSKSEGIAQVDGAHRRLRSIRHLLCHRMFDAFKDAQIEAFDLVIRNVRLG